MKKFFLILLLTFTTNAAFASSNNATSAKHPKQLQWEFDNIFGRFDKASIQRGYQVYKEVCSSCHGLSLVAYRNLEEIGFSEQEVKQIASEYEVEDGPNEDGDMYDRPGLASDKFVGPYANEQMARSVNGGAYPPDLSLITKARGDGPNYVYSLLTGYQDAPHGFEMSEGKNYNPYFEGHQIAMPEPLMDDGQVEYMDGTFATKEQMAIDVVNFLQWAAEPETEARKKMGVRTMLFLAILLILLIAAKKAVWKDIK